MMVVNSFDLWQKDVFFSAAEEVQKSADMYVYVLCYYGVRLSFAYKQLILIFTLFRMESAYRLWIREKKDDIFKELQAALGTAKWQVLFWEPLSAQKSFLNNPFTVFLYYFGISVQFCSE